MNQSKTRRFAAKVGRRTGKTLSILALVLVLLAGGATAYAALRDSAGIVTEVLEKAEVSCVVNEDYSVTNTGNIPALIRVRVVVNQTDGNALLPGEVPSYTVGSGWVQIGNHLYCQQIVSFEEGKNSTPPAISIADPGNAQILVTVLADAIQATPQTAAQEAWGHSFSDGGWS